MNTINKISLNRACRTAQKMFSIKDFFSICDQICSFLQFPADLVTFTEEIFNGKLSKLSKSLCTLTVTTYEMMSLARFQ